MPKVFFVAPISVFNGNPLVYGNAAHVRSIKPRWRKPLPVLARINGSPREKPWRINMMPIGTGDFYLYLHGDIRGAARTKVGDRVRLEIQFDPTCRTGPMHPMPSGVRMPLSRDAKATKAWGARIPSRKEEILRYFARLKSRDARARNVARAVHVLSGKKGRFMGGRGEWPAPRCTEGQTSLIRQAAASTYASQLELPNLHR
jgi:hypothetical protein